MAERTKRAYGRGCVYEKRPGCWYIQYRCKGETVRETAKLVAREYGFEARTKRDAQECLSRRLAELSAGRGAKPDARRKTLADALERVRERYRSRSAKSQATVGGHIAILERLIGADTRLREIDEDTVAHYIDVRRTESTQRKVPVTVATMNRELSILRLGLRNAEKHRWIARVPRIERAGKEEPRDLYASPAEVKRLIETLPDWHADFIEFLHLTTWRFGEAQGLCWRDVKARSVECPAARTKTRKAKVLPLSRNIRDILERAWRRRLGEDPEEFVFHQPSGTAIGDHRVRWASAKEKAGVDPDLRIHDLRHCGITNLRRSGVPGALIMEIAGHSGGVHFGYHHVATDDLLVAFERVEKYLGEYREEGEVVPWSGGGSNSGSNQQPEGLVFRPTGTDSATAKP